MWNHNKHVQLVFLSMRAGVTTVGQMTCLTHKWRTFLLRCLPSDILNGSAVCVYRMEDVVRAFKGNFLHKEGPQYKWAEFTGKVPYPRPGTVSRRKFSLSCTVCIQASDPHRWHLLPHFYSTCLFSLSVSQQYIWKLQLDQRVSWWRHLLQQDSPPVAGSAEICNAIKFRPILWNVQACFYFFKILN